MNEGSVIVFQGCRGSGKTLSMVFHALSFSYYGWIIYSNFKNNFSFYLSDLDIINLDKSSFLKNCVILIDEMQVFFDSRNWKSNSSIKFSNFIQQIRKRNIILMGTTQYIDTVEKRIRQHINTLIRPSFDEVNQICYNQIIDLTSLESFSFVNSYNICFDARPIFSFYDTHELI